MTDWNAGLDQVGGIPEYSQGANAVTDYGADNSGSSNAHSQISNCLNGISNDEYCYLPAGTYRISGLINIPSRKALRGAGPSTVLKLYSSGMLEIGGTKNYGSEIDMTADPDFGDKTFTLASTSGLSAGDYVSIYQDNDDDLPATSTGEYSCNWCGDDTNGNIIILFIQLFLQVRI